MLVLATTLLATSPVISFLPSTFSLGLQSLSSSQLPQETSVSMLL